MAPAASCSCPGWCRKQFRNVGETRARIVGFFASNTELAIADEVGQPIGSRVIGSPSPELAGVVSRA